MFEDYNIHARHPLALHCLITLQSPLSHIGEVVGNVSNLNTLKLIDPEGQARPCFVYSGNALRNGILRRQGIADALTQLGLTVNPDLHHTLFAGGRIDGSTGSDLELDARIRTLMPGLSVLGTAKPANVFGVKDAQMISGRLNVGSAFLVCYESANYVFSQLPGILPSGVREALSQLEQAKRMVEDDPFASNDDSQLRALRAELIPRIRKELKTSYEFLVSQQTTRRDSTTDPGLQSFLPQRVEQLALPLGGYAEEPAAKKGKKGQKTAGEAPAKKDDRMIASDVLIMGGAKMYSRWDFNGTDIEEGFLYAALMQWAKSPYLGGKNQRGNGLASIQLWYVDPNTGERGRCLEVGLDQQVMSARAEEYHARYQDYLARYRAYLEEGAVQSQIRGFLGNA